MSPTTSPGRARAATVAVVTLLLLAACGKSSPAAKATTTAPPTTAAATTTTAAPTTAPTTAAPATTAPADAAAALAGLKAKAQGALLTAKDLGATFTDSPFTPSTQPGLCGAPSPDKVLPAAVLVGSDAGSDTKQAQFEEEIRVYQDPAEAKQAYADFQTSVGCAKGSLAATDGSTESVTIGAADDVSSINKNITQGFAKSIKGADFEGEGVVMQLQSAIVTLQFDNAPGVDTTTLPDPQALVNTAVDRVASA